MLTSSSSVDSYVTSNSSKLNRNRVGSRTRKGRPVCGLQCDLGYWLQRIGVVVDSDLACGTKLDHLAKGVLGRGCWVPDRILERSCGIRRTRIANAVRGGDVGPQIKRRSRAGWSVRVRPQVEIVNLGELAHLDEAGRRHRTARRDIGSIFRRNDRHNNSAAGRRIRVGRCGVFTVLFVKPDPGVSVV